MLRTKGARVTIISPRGKESRSAITIRVPNVKKMNEQDVFIALDALESADRSLPYQIEFDTVEDDGTLTFRWYVLEKDRLLTRSAGRATSPVEPLRTAEFTGQIRELTPVNIQRIAEGRERQPEFEKYEPRYE
jgi:hypothetical protein